jgi:sporulation protein YlmC with PRC-barrel domain
MQQPRALQESKVLFTSRVLGAQVKNLAGEELGKIEELIIDPKARFIAYAILSFGGFLGLGEQLFAIPWCALTLPDGDSTFILNVEKEVFEDAPGFNQDNWPDMGDRRWGAVIYKYYGYIPYW